MNSVRLLTGGNTACKAAGLLQNSSPMIVSPCVCVSSLNHPRLNPAFHVCVFIPQQAA